MDSLIDRIRQNIEIANQAIERAAQSAGRHSSAVRMVVVTKTHPADVIEAVIEAGACILGENYPDESLPKIQSLTSHPNIEWHMIGHVQSRKSAIVAQHFHLLHSLDSLRLAERLDRQVGELGLRAQLPVLLEFNIAEEESKHGWPAYDEGHWENLVPEVEHLLGLKHLAISGIMTMPPLFDKPEESRPYFVKTRKLQTFFDKRFPSTAFSEISMGTSADYAVAVQEGATLVRIGQAILGPRPAKP
jgi:PLP dependent protein